jgi:hypothetical protein
MDDRFTVMVNYVVKDGMNYRNGTRLLRFTTLENLEAWLAGLPSVPGYSSDTIYDLPGPILTPDVP